MHLSVDFSAALEQAKQLYDQQREHDHHLVNNHVSVPVEAFGAGLAGIMAGVSQSFDAAQQIQRAHTRRMMDAAQNAQQLIDQLRSAEDANRTELAGGDGR